MIRCTGILVPLALGACGAKIDEQPLPREVASALELALTRNEPERCAEIFAPDAQIIPEDDPVVEGTAAIVAYCRSVSS
ncbi:MAG: hypothetical protein L6Q83_03665, partial [Gammaproteobacteria bacterium]|nr:hypothetical protein [Gammaproteobacteria bacterium]